MAAHVCVVGTCLLVQGVLAGAQVGCDRVNWIRSICMLLCTWWRTFGLVNCPVTATLNVPLGCHRLLCYHEAAAALNSGGSCSNDGDPCSSVGIATRYWAGRSWDRNPVMGEIFRTVQADPASCTTSTGCSLGAERPRRGIDHPPTSFAEIKERVELHFPSPLCLHDRV